MPSKHIRTLVFGMIVLPLMGVFFQVASNPVVGPFLSAQLATGNDIIVITGSTCPGGSLHNKVILSEDPQKPGHFLRDLMVPIPCSNLPHRIQNTLKKGVNQKVSIVDTVSGETVTIDVPANGDVRTSLADPNNLKQNIELLVSTDPSAAGTFLVVEELDSNDNTIAYYEWSSRGAGTSGTDFIFLPKNSRFRFTAYFGGQSQSIIKTSADADQNPPDFSAFINNNISTTAAAVCDAFDANGDGVNDQADIQQVEDVFNNIKKCENTLNSCDFNGDNQVTKDDLSFIEDFVNGVSNTCPSLSARTLGSLVSKIAPSSCTNPLEDVFYVRKKFDQSKGYEVEELVKGLCRDFTQQPFMRQSGVDFVSFSGSMTMLDGRTDNQEAGPSANNPDVGFYIQPITHAEDIQVRIPQNTIPLAQSQYYVEVVSDDFLQKEHYFIPVSECDPSTGNQCLLTFTVPNNKYRVYLTEQPSGAILADEKMNAATPNIVDFSQIRLTGITPTPTSTPTFMLPPSPYCGFYDIDGDGVNSSTQLDANGDPINDSNTDINTLLDIILGKQPQSACQNVDLNGDPLGNCDFVGGVGQSTEPNVVDLTRLSNFYSSRNTACEEPYIPLTSSGSTPPTSNPSPLTTSSVEITTQCDQPGSRYYLSMLVRNPQTKNFEVLEEVSDLCENWEKQPLLIENFDGTLDYAFSILNGDGPKQGFTNNTFAPSGGAQFAIALDLPPLQLPEKIIIPTPVNPGVPELEIRLQRYSSGVAQESYWKVVSDIGEEIFYLNPGEYEVEISLNGQSEHFRMNTNDPNSIPDFSNFLAGSAPTGTVPRPPVGSPELDLDIISNGRMLTHSDINIFDGSQPVFCEGNTINLKVTCIFPTPGFKTLKIEPKNPGFMPTMVNVNVGTVQSIGPLHLRFFNKGEMTFYNFIDHLMMNGNISDKSLKQFIDFAISNGL